jgi:hypothetical protein
VTDFAPGIDVLDLDAGTAVTETVVTATTGTAVVSATAGAATNAYILRGAAFQITGALDQTGNGGAVENAIIAANLRGVADGEELYVLIDNGTSTGVYRVTFASIANGDDVVNSADELSVVLVAVLDGVNTDQIDAGGSIT